MTPLFNSLGSNYSPGFVTLALRQLWAEQANAQVKLMRAIQERWPGKVVLTYKGRDAIEYGLKVLKLEPGDEVLTQAFTCHAIEEAITRVKAVPVYVDLDPIRLNPSVATLSAAYKKTTRAKVVIIQHTLGLPAEIKAIRKWCDAQGLWLIEDLAQAAGAHDETGLALGSLADLVILSFGRDKVIDAVTGGAVILRQEKLSLLSGPIPKPPTWAVIKDLTYPALTSVIRAWFPSGVGKIIWKVARLSGWLSSPVTSPTQTMTTLPASLACLALQALTDLDESLAHRRSVAAHYYQALSKRMELPAIYQQKEILKSSTHQRFLVTVADPDKVITALAKKHLYISDRWYRHAVDAGSLGRETVYQPGSCPVAEKLAKTILNLPTHREVTSGQIAQIAQALYVTVST